MIAGDLNSRLSYLFTTVKLKDSSRNYFTQLCRRHPIEEPQIAEENCNDDEVTLFLFGHCTMAVFANSDLKLQEKRNSNKVSYPKGTTINDVPHFLAIFDLPNYLVLPYNVQFWGLSWTTLPTLILDDINGRSCSVLLLRIVPVFLNQTLHEEILH